MRDDAAMAPEICGQARRYAGMRLSELGSKAGGLDYTAVAMGVRRLESQSCKDAKLRAAMRRISKECAL